MHKVLLATAALFVLPLVAATPAFAMKGIDAARSCEAQGNRCKVIYDTSGGEVIVIIVDGQTIVCPTPQDECFVWTKVGGTRLDHINVDALMGNGGLAVEPAKGDGSVRPFSVAPRSGALSVLR